MGDSRGNSSRVFTREFKLAAVKELDSGKPARYVTRQLEIKPNLLYRWRRELRKHPAKALSGHGNKMLADSREAELERKIATKKCIVRSMRIWLTLAARLDRSSKASTIASVSTQRSGIVLRSSSNISRQLAAGGLSAKDRGPIPRTTGPASEQFERDEQHEFS